MARTSSVAQRRLFAGATQMRAVVSVAGPLPFQILKYISPERHALIVTIVFLTAMGVAVPHLDDQTLSTLLVVAGAGLAALLHFLPWRSTGDLSRDPATSKLAASLKPARFCELAVNAKGSIDRTAWAKLTAHMSHELRTPLNAVLGFSELMSNEVFGPLGSSCYSAYARDIHASGRLLLKSAEDALAITALLTGTDEKLTPTATSLGWAVEEALAFVGPDLLHQSIKVAYSIPENLQVVADPQATRQILINVLAEFVRTSDAGAALTIDVATTARGVRLSVTQSAAGSKLLDSSDAFSVILARTLCELSGADLSRTIAADGTIECAMLFVPLTQNDLFGN